MYQSKKIGVFISHIMGFYQQNICQGIIDKALEYGYTTEIFASMDGENLGDYSIGEESILRIPNFNEFRGVIFASETYPNEALRLQIEATLTAQCTCPIIDISTRPKSFPAISIDNNSTTYTLVQHLIEVHQCKRICYLGCQTESYFSDLRATYYEKAMKEAGLFIGANDRFVATYTDTSVALALKQFTEEGLPDAIVCYNDRMALLFMEAALKKGYQLPEDMLITGCDHTKEGQNITPGLTTVTFPVYELGGKALESLLKAINGEALPSSITLPAQPVYHASCGCPSTQADHPLLYQRTLLNRIDATEASIFSSMRMSAAFQNVTDIDDAMDLLENYIQEVSCCKEFYLCLYHGWDSVSKQILDLTEQPDASRDRNEIQLKLAIRDGRRLPECSFFKTSLLPEHLYRGFDCAYLYIPLFFQDKKFGYVALAYKQNQIDYHFQFVHWFMNINQMLQRLCDAKNTSVLVKHLEELYTKDALTGLYNKHGYLLHEKALMEEAIAEKKTLTCFIFDLNGLKHINDTYGHNEGDFAIQVLGHALASTTSETDICARFSGDEFYVLSISYQEEDAKNLIHRVHKYLENYNKLSHKEYPIATSGGFAQAIPDATFHQEDIKALYALADQEMYKEKKEAYARA